MSVWVANCAWVPLVGKALLEHSANGAEYVALVPALPPVLKLAYPSHSLLTHLLYTTTVPLVCGCVCSCCPVVVFSAAK